MGKAALESWARNHVKECHMTPAESNNRGILKKTLHKL